MNNIDEDFDIIVSKEYKHSILKKCEETMKKQKKDYQTLKSSIETWVAQLTSIGLPVKQVKYRRPNEKDEYGAERWRTWDF